MCTHNRLCIEQSHSRHIGLGVDQGVGLGNSGETVIYLNSMDKDHQGAACCFFK